VPGLLSSFTQLDEVVDAGMVDAEDDYLGARRVLPDLILGERRNRA
jgi:hypothetical protein